MGLLAAAFAFSSAVFAPVGGAFGMSKVSATASATAGGGSGYSDESWLHDDDGGVDGDVGVDDDVVADGRWAGNNAFLLSCNTNHSDGGGGGDGDGMLGPRPHEFGYFMFVAVLFLCVSVVGALLIKKEPAHAHGRAQGRNKRSNNIELTEALIVGGDSSK